MPEEVDYGKLGLKCGLEIHQQLDTNKLFCSCLSVLRKDEPEFRIKRKLHAVAGESGEVDIAAAYQHSLDKEFLYEGYDTTCLVELDEEPPHQINQQALRIALQVSALLNAKVFSATQIMRKTVVDGSNTSGFQRTVLIARDGFIETNSGRVGIASVCLEEDSARIIGDKNTGNVAVYRLDRLGIPLIEIATEPDIKNPKQAKEVALRLGEILRSCHVKRGLGTIRQDVNLSIKGGKRIELKGFQDIDNIERAIKIEIERQIRMINGSKTKVVSDDKKVTINPPALGLKLNLLQPEVRKVLPNGESEFLRPMPGSARMYPETDLPLLKISRYMTDDAKKNLPKMKKDIEKELEQEGLSEEMIKLLFKYNKLDEFRELLHVVNKPQLVGKVLLIYPKEIASREKISLEDVENILNKDALGNVLEDLKKGRISEGDLKHILTKLVKGEEQERHIDSAKEDAETTEERILKIIKEKPGLSLNAYMGLVMKEFKGKITGAEVSEILKKYVK